MLMLITIISNCPLKVPIRLKCFYYYPNVTVRMQSPVPNLSPAQTPSASPRLLSRSAH